MKHYVRPDWWIHGQRILTSDLNRIECGLIATDILTPGQNDPPNMKVFVSSGYVYFDEQAYYFSKLSSPEIIAPTVNPRWDILYLDNDGLLKIVQGTEVEAPQKPQFESGWIPIAYVYNRPTEIKLIDYFDDDDTNGLIIDARKFITAADMQKSVYDTNNSGVVDNSDRLGGVLADSHLLVTGERKLTGHLDFDNHRAIELLDPVLDQDAATKKYIDSKPFRLEKSDKVAGEPLTLGDITYLKNDGKLYKANASSFVTAKGLLATVLSESVGIDESVSVMSLGMITDAVWSWTRGAILYLGATAGEITETKPTGLGQFERKIGFAYDTDTVYFNPDSTVYEIS